ncbi:MAG TPA: aromatic ring-hydroxylating dioxygenase subunit alpha [Ramlibacter sp.]|uniref:aromatic ring-hydroxylating dioxygenase subunit alpha n=1 Tax=Ramlibacter sp. TaxID=1917967 RepID=UPI002D39C230|nr:aromatic ring-hydroxylating dioxygenase subunit alpha [Ramlibacter sp.]HZY19955.1 aromatic ring-hydroxylating dioxygenase subunit alpha [Ramlibacter sp.]
MNGDSWPCALASGWHPLAHARELGARPLARTLMDVPVVLFRSGGQAVALVDRCPHRNVPLSCGQVRDGAIHCPYHGWAFDAGGRCVRVPGAEAVPDVAARALAVQECAGLVWVSLAPIPAAFPGLPPVLDEPTRDGFWWPLPASRARVLDAIENLLDPAHPHFLHPYLVRRPGARRAVRVRFTSDERGGEARYDEAEASLAWLPQLFEGRRTTVVGRYLAPSIAQLAFDSDAGSTLTLTVIFTPESQERTRPFAHFSTRRGLLPAWLKRWLLIAFHRPVLHQDRVMLARQAATIERFGEAAFSVGPMDLFGPLIWRLANGRASSAQQRELQFWL